MKRFRSHSCKANIQFVQKHWTHSEHVLQNFFLLFRQQKVKPLIFYSADVITGGPLCIMNRKQPFMAFLEARPTFDGGKGYFTCLC